jgi:uncharacterized membrane protein YozB (DUF420 family)
MAAQKDTIQSSKRPRTPVLTTKNLSIVVTGLVLVVALLKADTKDIPEVVKILFGSDTFTVVGWTLAVVFLLGGAIFVKLQDRLHQREISRVSGERDELQKLLLNKTLK